MITPTRHLIIDIERHKNRELNISNEHESTIYSNRFFETNPDTGLLSVGPFPLPEVRERGLTIYAGDVVHETRLGPVYADRPLAPSVLVALVDELERQGCERDAVLSARPVRGGSGRFHFDLRGSVEIGD